MTKIVSVLPLLQAQLLSQECGQHLVEAEDLLQKHGLLEGDITAQSERVEALNAAALRFSQLQGESGAGAWGGDFHSCYQKPMTPEREMEGVSALSSKHRLGSRSIGDISSGH